MGHCEALGSERMVPVLVTFADRGLEPTSMVALTDRTESAREQAQALVLETKPVRWGVIRWAVLGDDEGVLVDLGSVDQVVVTFLPRGGERVVCEVLPSPLHVVPTQKELELARRLAGWLAEDDTPAALLWERARAPRWLHLTDERASDALAQRIETANTRLSDVARYVAGARVGARTVISVGTPECIHLLECEGVQLTLIGSFHRARKLAATSA